MSRPQSLQCPVSLPFGSCAQGLQRFFWSLIPLFYQLSKTPSLDVYLMKVMNIKFENLNDQIITEHIMFLNTFFKF